MRLYELIKDVAETSLPDMDITGLTSDTRGEIREGSLFVCIKGNTFDGHDAAVQMLEKGCAAVVCERDLGLDKQILVEDTRAAFPLLCSAWFGHPERELALIGVTGTNGKTTITTVIKKVLDGFGFKVGLIGTCQNEIGDEIIPTARTTPEPYDLYELFRKMADAGCKYVVMEVSSQGLEQKRVQGCRFSVGVFTNLTQDHLDVHGTMENYYQAKKLLFDISDTAIINIDDESGVRYTKEIPCPYKTYSAVGNADFMAADVVLSTAGVKYVFGDGKVRKNVSFNMPGLFNVSNSLAVIACMEVLGYEPCRTIKEFEKIQGVRGRAEIVPTGRDFTVICDYAHTPDALENVLSAIKEGANGKVKCLFGCGGNRDRTKRAPMAAAAADHADFLIVTSDNPRNEDPDEIINDVLEGLKGKDTPYIRITDRREAIYWAVKNAEKNDIIVLAGKGHEDYQILAGGVKIHFDEREVVADALAQAFGEEQQIQ